METKLNMVPEKLDRVTSAIDDSNSEYEQLLKLKPIYTIVSLFLAFLLFYVNIQYYCKILHYKKRHASLMSCRVDSVSFVVRWR